MAIRWPRSPSLRRLARLFRVGRDADATGMSSAEALGKAREVSFDRRVFLGGAAAAAALAIAPKPARAGNPPNVDVGIVGAGLAGLQCAYQLGVAGLRPTLYEASDRIGG